MPRVLAVLVLALLAAAPVASAKPRLIDRAVSFEVRNVNRTDVACEADGATRTVRGHLTAPRRTLKAKRPPVSLLLHGFGYAEFFWRFSSVPGYNAAKQLARQGHPVVTVDRPGYGTSRPGGDGESTCLGSQADIAHQIVSQLKAGRYTVAGRKPVRFARAALLGHSAGGAIVELAAATFPDIDAVGILSYGDGSASPLVLSQTTQQMGACMNGGAADDPGYAPLGATEEDFRQGHLNAPGDPAVYDAVVAQKTNDPCGDVASLTGTLLTNMNSAMNIDLPVLLLQGADDAFFPASAQGQQQDRLESGGADVTAVSLPDTGHGFTFGNTHRTVVSTIGRWMKRTGF